MPLTKRIFKSNASNGYVRKMKVMLQPIKFFQLIKMNSTNKDYSNKETVSRWNRAYDLSTEMTINFMIFLLKNQLNTESWERSFIPDYQSLN